MFAVKQCGRHLVWPQGRNASAEFYTFRVSVYLQNFRLLDIEMLNTNTPREVVDI